MSEPTAMGPKPDFNVEQAIEGALNKPGGFDVKTGALTIERKTKDEKGQEITIQYTITVTVGVDAIRDKALVAKIAKLFKEAIAKIDRTVVDPNNVHIISKGVPLVFTSEFTKDEATVKRQAQPALETTLSAADQGVLTGLNEFKIGAGTPDERVAILQEAGRYAKTYNILKDNLAKANIVSSAEKNKILAEILGKIKKEPGVEAAFTVFQEELKTPTPAPPLSPAPAKEAIEKAAKQLQSDLEKAFLPETALPSASTVVKPDTGEKVSTTEKPAATSKPPEILTAVQITEQALKELQLAAELAIQQQASKDKLEKIANDLEDIADALDEFNTDKNNVDPTLRKNAFVILDSIKKEELTSYLTQLTELINNAKKRNDNEQVKSAENLETKDKSLLDSWKQAVEEKAKFEKQAPILQPVSPQLQTTPLTTMPQTPTQTAQTGLTEQGTLFTSTTTTQPSQPQPILHPQIMPQQPPPPQQIQPSPVQPQLQPQQPQQPQSQVLQPPVSARQGPSTQQPSSKGAPNVVVSQQGSSEQVSQTSVLQSKPVRATPRVQVKIDKEKDLTNAIEKTQKTLKELTSDSERFIYPQENEPPIVLTEDKLNSVKTKLDEIQEEINSMWKFVMVKDIADVEKVYQRRAAVSKLQIDLIKFCVNDYGPYLQNKDFRVGKKDSYKPMQPEEYAGREYSYHLPSTPTSAGITTTPRFTNLQNEKKGIEQLNDSYTFLPVPPDGNCLYSAFSATLIRQLMLKKQSGGDLTGFFNTVRQNCQAKGIKDEQEQWIVAMQNAVDTAGDLPTVMEGNYDKLVYATRRLSVAVQISNLNKRAELEKTKNQGNAVEIGNIEKESVANKEAIQKKLKPGEYGDESDIYQPQVKNSHLNINYSCCKILRYFIRSTYAQSIVLSRCCGVIV